MRVMLLIAGTKKRQQRDIEAAKAGLQADEAFVTLNGDACGKGKKFLGIGPAACQPWPAFDFTQTAKFKTSS
jgi:hypothetical protein